MITITYDHMWSHVMIHEGITMPYDAIRCHTMPYLDIMYTYENPYSIMVKKNSDIYKIYMRHVYKKILKNDFRSCFFYFFYTIWKSNTTAVQNRSQKWWDPSKEGSRVTFRRPTKKIPVRPCFRLINFFFSHMMLYGIFFFYWAETPINWSFCLWVAETGLARTLPDHPQHFWDRFWTAEMLLFHMAQKK